ncbi:hypothetical protein HJC23_003665 [Cyclotella cryptica]|uniref:PiggyBac transposable element-derived protein domain-containing protein n=1 Tax=Cyclotella cryptica TaxID=29204 RepID=A0ABD3QKB8_9STRA
MSLPTASAAAASPDRDNDSPPRLPLIQEVFAHLPSPPPLPPPKDEVDVDINPDLSLQEDGSSAGSDRMPTVEAIIINDSSALVANDSSNRGPNDAGWEQYFGRKIKYKGEGVRALKSLFLQSPGQHPDIPSDLYMNGVVMSVPWRSQQEYGIMWDYSALSVALDKSAICHAIAKTDYQCINLLKMAHFIFDRVHPNGVKSVPNLAPVPGVRNLLQPRHAVAPAATAQNTRRSCTADVPSGIRQRQRIADMRMAPINNQISTPARKNTLLQFDGNDNEDSVEENTTGPSPEDDNPKEIDFIDRTEEDILHGYLPDSTYNPESMESEGVCPKELNWSYSNVVPGTPNTTYIHYNGAGPCLKKYMDRKFDTLLEHHCRGDVPYLGNDFEDESDKLDRQTPHPQELKRFLQIRAALHPEVGASDIGDKYHLLRAAIQSLNEHAKKSFILGREISFDEGGIARKSWYNPLHQYNSSKPDKYRINFFVMAHDLPTTQKTVVNAIVLSGIANEPNGMREIYMDNRYSTPTLFVLLQEKYSILACRTTQSNRTGWNTQILPQRGTSLVKFDPVNKVLFREWNDNKVVSFILMLGLFGMSTIQRQIRANKVDLQIPEALKRYSADNFMGGVNNMDKDKKIGGSFTSLALLRKWYHMGLMGRFDFMIVNGRQAWNMSTETKTERFKSDNAKFHWGLAEELLRFKDESVVDFVSEQQLSHKTAMMIAGHQPQSIPRKSTEGLWSSNPNYKYKQRGAKDTRRNDEKRAYSVMTSHPIYLWLRRKYSLDSKKRKRDEPVGDDDEDDEESDFE